MRWKPFLFRISVWLIAEIGLNCLGLDTMADYSEFIWDRNYLVVQSLYY